MRRTTSSSISASSPSGSRGDGGRAAPGDEALWRDAWRSRRSTSQSRRARWSRCSARTGRGRRRLSRSSSACADPTRDARSCSAATRAGRRSRTAIGVTPQDGGFPLTLRAGEIIDLVRAHFPRPVPRHEVLERFGLESIARRQTGGLSGGERRRLSVALAFAGRPQAVFLDEPTTGLDVEARRAAWREIAGFAAEGGTVPPTTHYLEEAEALASRIVLIATGGSWRRGRLRSCRRGRPRPALEEAFLAARPRRRREARASPRQSLDPRAAPVPGLQRADAGASRRSSSCSLSPRHRMPTRRSCSRPSPALPFSPLRSSSSASGSPPSGNRRGSDSSEHSRCTSVPVSRPACSRPRCSASPRPRLVVAAALATTDAGLPPSRWARARRRAGPRGRAVRAARDRARLLGLAARRPAGGERALPRPLVRRRALDDAGAPARRDRIRSRRSCRPASSETSSGARPRAISGARATGSLLAAWSAAFGLLAAWGYRRDEGRRYS